MPKFIKLTQNDKTIFFNFDKVEMFALDLDGLSTKIFINPKDSFNVNELPVQIMEMINDRPNR